jgi:hypothetical protein
MMETDPLPASNGAATPAPVVAPPVQITRVNDRLSESLKLEHKLVKVSIRRLGTKFFLHRTQVLSFNFIHQNYGDNNAC